MVLGEHFVCLPFALGFVLPSFCVYILFGHVVCLFRFVVWVWVWYGWLVFGSYLAAMAIALRACFLACCRFLGSGCAVRAPSAYGAPVPMA